MADRKFSLLFLDSIIAKSNVVRTAGLSLLHHLGDGRFSIPSEGIDAASDQKVSTKILSQAKEFEDVTLPVTDMHTTSR